MTPNYQHVSLFVAPRPAPGVRAVGRRRPAVDDGAEAMRRLRHPFTVDKTGDREYGE